MMRIIKKIGILLILPLQSLAQQPVLNLDSILHRIEKNNLLLQSYDLKAKSYQYKADAGTAWMAPMIGVGTFMTPYPGQEVMNDADKGSLMFQVEQDIPNPAKLKAQKKVIESQAEVENASRGVTFNNLKAQAKSLYFTWIVSQQRINILQQNDKIMQTMKKIEQIRYPYNQSQLGGVYRASAKIEENQNMIRMQEGEIANARASLNALMHEHGDYAFEIDTSYRLRFIPSHGHEHDTILLASSRKDIQRMDKTINSMQLNIDAMKQESKPDFRIRLDHMSPLGSMMPKAYSVMGMISIPIAPWSSKMYKSEIKGMQYDIQAMQKEREAMLQETQGMLYGMQYQIEAMEKRIKAMEEKIVPSLRKNMEASFLNYQENKLELPAVIDSWEALTMMQMNVLDEKLKLYQMIIDHEKELYR
jgi:outer membrane protein, heavy metal efflux system